MAQGDVPYFKSLADQYAISDNFHQSVMGGTGANHIMFGYADGIFFSDANGNPATPPNGQIENPNSQQGTNNFWVNDGYGSTATNDGGSYSNCSDSTQPGVTAVESYLSSINVKPNCEAGAYYLLNNYNPGYVGDGTVDPAVDGPFTIPPVTKHHLGDLLNGGQVSWAYFGENWNDYAADPNPATNPAGYLYCNICNPFAYSTQTMANEQQRLTHIHDTTDFYNDIENGILPAVSIVKPSALNDGHPASSKLDLFESFTHKIIAELQANPELWASTAVFITFDEGGGYWDSGYIQPVDFFGDGTRIPLIVVSPYSTGGIINHNYATMSRSTSSSSATGASARSRPAAATTCRTRRRPRTTRMSRPTGRRSTTCSGSSRSAKPQTRPIRWRHRIGRSADKDGWGRRKPAPPFSSVGIAQRGNRIDGRPVLPGDPPVARVDAVGQGGEAPPQIFLLQGDEPSFSRCFSMKPLSRSASSALFFATAQPT
ncbi:MAG: alkaline phosphatase family protein [Aliidongia sp.]